jgi:formylglycine-generating enzyme required for sulfatase activity
MGSEDFYAEEQPVRRVAVEGFWIDRDPVTVAQFRRFVKATGHVTVAERPLDPDDYPDADPKLLVPGALVFRPSRGPVDLRDFHNWWDYVPGATWQAPEGPASDTYTRGRHPVTQVAYEDAAAYAAWAGKALPTEAEWEYAARGGRAGERYPWGAELEPGGEHRMNVFQGRFPNENTCADGYAGTAPVDAYEPNGYGLYNMTGNVWEWCADWFDAGAYAASRSNDPRGPAWGTHRVMRGGSYLCHASYCNRYRVDARSANEPDSSTGNLGFRVVR